MQYLIEYYSLCDIHLEVLVVCSCIFLWCFYHTYRLRYYIHFSVHICVTFSFQMPAFCPFLIQKLHHPQLFDSSTRRISFLDDYGKYIRSIILLYIGISQVMVVVSFSVIFPEVVYIDVSLLQQLPQYMPCPWIYSLLAGVNNQRFYCFFSLTIYSCSYLYLFT